ncbi:MAG TPA: hypothetical protein VNI36_10690 [Candidatus Dormibacteraeota bacterium]|nr:hypothetical protein [Candidatus Dormibacteraeota bacterium]
MLSDPVHAQFVWPKTSWQAAEFETLTRLPRQVKLALHSSSTDGKFLGNAKNGMNGLVFGTGVPADQVQIVCTLNGPANMLNYSDYVWQKYRVGEFIKLNDPKTGKPALRNFYYPSKAGASLKYTSKDPSDPKSAEQDASIQGLQARGVRFLSCHSSVEEAARGLIKKNKLSVTPEEIARDIQAHTLPNVLIVPSMVGAIAYLQCVGHYAYLKA